MQRSTKWVHNGSRCCWFVFSEWADDWMAGKPGCTFGWFGDFLWKIQRSSGQLWENGVAAVWKSITITKKKKTKKKSVECTNVRLIEGTKWRRNVLFFWLLEFCGELLDDGFLRRFERMDGPWIGRDQARERAQERRKWALHLVKKGCATCVLKTGAGEIRGTLKEI